MRIFALAGTVSHLDRITTVTETRHGVRSDRTLAFRLDGHPVTYRFGEGTQIDNGDVVTATGRQRGGHFEIWALRNETTGVIYESRATPLLILSVFMILFGLGTLRICVGFIPLPFGIYYLCCGLNMQKADKLLRVTSAPARPTIHAPPPLPPPTSTQPSLPAEIYLVRNGQKAGPYSPEQVKASLASGILTSTDLAWHNGITDWVPLGSIIK
jgi:hypothetical protein